MSIENYKLMKEAGNARVERNPDESASQPILLIKKKPNDATLVVEEVSIPVSAAALLTQLDSVRVQIEKAEQREADLEELIADIEVIEAEMAAEQEAEEEADGEA